MTLRNNGARRTTRTVVRVLIASTEAFCAADAGYSLNYADTRVGREIQVSRPGNRIKFRFSGYSYEGESIEPLLRGILDYLPIV